MSPRRRDIQNVIKLISLPCAVFDKDRSGFASSSEIKTVMANLGVHFTDEEIQEMMIEVTEISRALSPSHKIIKGGCEWRQSSGFQRVQSYDDR